VLDLVVLADDLAFLGGRVGVDAEGPDPEVDPDRVPVRLALFLLPGGSGIWSM